MDTTYDTRINPAIALNVARNSNPIVTYGDTSCSPVVEFQSTDGISFSTDPFYEMSDASDDELYDDDSPLTTTVFKVANSPIKPTIFNPKPLAEICTDAVCRVDHRDSFVDIYDEYTNYHLQFIDVKFNLDQVRMYTTIALASSYNFANRDGSLVCKGCGAFLSTFQTNSEHVDYHMRLMRGVYGNFSHYITWRRILSCAATPDISNRYFLRRMIYARNRVCQLCRVYNNSFETISCHDDFHYMCRDVLIRLRCFRCQKVFKDSNASLRHFWHHRQHKHLNPIFKRLELSNPVHREESYGQIAPLDSTCDINVVMAMNKENYRNGSIFIRAALDRKNLFSEYRSKLKSMKKSDSSTMLSNLMKCDQHIYRESVLKPLLDDPYWKIKRFARKAQDDLVNDTQPQFFDHMRIFGADFSVLPKDLYDQLAKLFSKIIEKASEWARHVYDFVCEHYKLFGVVICALGAFLVIRLCTLDIIDSDIFMLSVLAGFVVFSINRKFDEIVDISARLADEIQAERNPPPRYISNLAANVVVPPQLIVGRPTFVNPGLNLEECPPPYTNDTEPQGNDDNDAYAFVTIAAKLLGLTVAPASVKTFISINRLAFNMSQGLRSFAYLTDFIRQNAQKIVEYFYGTDLERDILSFEQLADVCGAWIRTIGELDTVDGRKQLQYDEIVQMRALNARDIGIYLVEQSVKSKQGAHVRSALSVMLKTARELAEIAEKAVNCKDMRADPWLLWFQGKPGIGKSAAVQMICNMLLEGYDQRMLNRTYAINGSLKHFDGYTSQPFCLIDDFLALADSQHESESIDIFMKCKSATAYRVPMADLSEKGHLFESPLMLVTSNNLYPNVDTRVHDLEAFYRRRNVLWEAAIAPEYEGKPLAAIPLEVSMKMGHLVFQEYHPIVINKKIGEPVRFPEFIAKCRRSIAAHFILQRELLRRAKQYIPLILRHKRNKRVLEGDVGDVSTDAPEFINFDDFDESNDQSHSVYLPNEPLPWDRIPGHVVQFDETDQAHAEAELEKSVCARNKYYEPAKLQMLKIMSCVEKCRKNIRDYLLQYPLLAALCGLGLLVGAYKIAVSLMKKIFKVKDAKPEMTASGSFKKQFMNTAHTRQPGFHAIRHEGRTFTDHVGNINIQAEGCSDQNAMELMHSRLPWNLYDISRKSGIGALSMRATALEGRILLCPHHFFVGMSQSDLITVSNGYTEWTELFDPERLVSLKSEDGLPDIAAYEMGPAFPIQRKLGLHFVSESDATRTGTSEATLLHRVVGFSSVAEKSGIWGMSAKVTPIDKTYDIHYDVNKNGERKLFNIRTGWNFHGPTREGDCGSLLIFHDPSWKGKIGGMHVAGSKTKTLGYSTLITKEMIDCLVAQFQTKGLSVEDPPEEYFPQGLDTEPKVTPDGNFTCVGIIAPHLAVHAPMKTNIVPSLIHDLVRPHVSEPSVLSPKDPRNLSGQSPLKLGISKYGKPTKPFPKRELAFAVRDMAQELVMDWPGPVSDEISMQYVLHGSGDGSTAVNLNTSAGHPWNIEKPKGAKGKKWLIDADVFGNMEMLPPLIEGVKARLDKYSQGRRPFGLWIDTQKDELRPLEKISAGKTRLFTIAPVDFTVVTRIFFLKFVEAFQKDAGKFFSCVGVDCLADWERLCRRMEEVGDTGFDGDFGTFDGKLKPECIEPAVDSISDWYDMYVDHIEFWLGGKFYKFNQKQCRIIRRLIVDELIHTNQIVLNLVYQKHQGNPSGNPITSVLNTLVNAIYLRVAFYVIMGRIEVGLYRKHVRDEIYGDDNKIATSKDVREIFNFKSVSEFFAEYGIEYTPADKKTADGALYRPLNELRFLKQGIGMYRGLIRVPLMDKNTIYELTNWVTNKTNPVDQLYDNLENAMRFMALYGKQEFEQFKNDVDCALLQVGLTRVRFDLSSYYMELDSKFGLV